ncbi:MAG: TolB family protein [Clostridia bacterium]
MRFDDPFHPEDQQDPTISQLLCHLKKLRTSVPVNYELKGELRKKLLERMRQMELHAASQASGAAMPRKRRELWWYSGGILMLALAMFMWLGTSATIRYSAEALVLPTGVTNVTLSATANRLAWVSQKGMLELRTVHDEQQKRQLSKYQLPRTEGSYQEIAFAHNDEQLTAIEQTKDVTRIWIVTVSDGAIQASSRLLYEGKNVELQGAAWSPDNLYVAFTKIEHGKKEIWLTSTISSETKKLTEGSQAAWSPDGTRVSFVNENIVSVIDLPTGKISRLNQGEFPSWQSADRLTFTAPDGTLAEYTWAEEVTQTHTLMLPNGYETGIVQASWTHDGDHGLIKKKEKEQVQIALLTEK